MLSLEQKIDILRQAVEIADHWWVDILNCQVCIYRKKVEMSLDTILAKLKESSHFTIIHRKTCGENHVEFGFSTMGLEPTYFLWVNVPVEPAIILLDKFGLEITENKSIYPQYKIAGE